MIVIITNNGRWDRQLDYFFCKRLLVFLPLDWESSFHPGKSLWHIANTFFIQRHLGETETWEGFHFPESCSQFLESKLCPLPSPALPPGQCLPSPILVSLIWVTAWALLYGITFSPGSQFMQNTPRWESGNLPIRHSSSSKTLGETWSECLKTWLAQNLNSPKISQRKKNNRPHI